MKSLKESISSLMDSGLAAHQPEAEDLLRSLSSGDNGELVRCLNALGIALARAKDSRCLTVFDLALSVSPDSVFVLKNKARAAHILSAFKVAAEAFLKVAIGSPSDLDAWTSASVSAIEGFDTDFLFERIVPIAPYERFSDQQKGLFDYLLGRAFLLQGRFNESRGKLLSALERDPSLQPAAEYLLIAAAESGDIGAARNLLEQLHQRQWMNGELLQSLLTVLMRGAHFKEVIEFFHFSRVRGDVPLDARHLVVEACRATGQFSQALSILKDTKKALNGKLPLYSQISEIHTLGQLGELEERHAVEVAVKSSLDREGASGHTINPWMLFSFMDRPKLFKELGSAYSSSNSSGQRIKFASSSSEALHKTAKVIGFYSNEIRVHPVAECLKSILQHRFTDSDVAIFSLCAQRDAATEELSGLSDHFVDCSGMDYESTLKEVRSAQVDVLVDTTVFTAGGRPEFLLKGLAETQVNFLGFSGSSGSPAYDFIVGDEFLIPSGAEEDYSERVVRLDLPLLAMLLKNNASGESVRHEVRHGLGVKDEEFLFCCLAQSYKISLPLVECWARILRSSARFKIMLAEKHAAGLIDVLVKLGVERRQVIASGFESTRQGHLNRLGACDLFLDTYPYNAHSLAADALSAGLPVLGYAGESFASRVSGSLLHGLGLSELIVSDLSEYEKVACNLALDSSRADGLRQDLISNLSGRDFSSSYSDNFSRIIRGL